MIQNYLNVLLRTMRHKTMFSLINVMGLSLGLSCCMLIVLYVHDEYSFDRFHQNKDRIFRVIAEVNEKNKGIHRFGASGAITGPGLKAEIPEIVQFVRIASSPASVQANAQVFRQEVLFAEENFLSFFSFPLLAGDPVTALKHPNSVVLTRQNALKYFASIDCIGKSLKLKINEAFETFQVTGVLEDVPENSSIKLGMLIPIQLNKEITEESKWLGFTINTFLLLDEHADYKEVEKKISKVYASKVSEELKFARENAKVDLAIRLALKPIDQIHLDQDYVDNNNGVQNGSTPVYSYILIGIAIFTLLIACINFVNLSVANSLKRNKEIGIRKVIKANRTQLIAQFLGESLILCFLAFVLAVLISFSGLEKFNGLVNKHFQISSFFDLRLLAIFLSLFVVTGICAGIYPAMYLSGYSPVKNLKSRQGLSTRNYFGNTLIIIQFIFSTLLIIGTAVVHTQYDFLSDKDLGYDDRDILEIDLGDHADTKMIGLLRNEFEKEPSVMNTTGEFYSHQERIKMDGKEIDCISKMVDEKYLATLGIKLISGRNFSKKYATDAQEAVIVNQTFLKAAGLSGRDIGKTFGYVWTTDHARIIGVVQDYHHETVKETIKPLVLKVFPETAVSAGKLVVKLNPADIGSAKDAVSQACKTLMPYYPFSSGYRSDLNQQQYKREATWKRIVSLAAIIAILIASIGLLGLTVLTTEARIKEVGIRKVLGSSMAQIVWLFTIDFLKLVSIAIVIALPVAWWATDIWLRDFAYKAAITGWLFGACGILVAIIACTPVIFQSIRASLKNPADVLASD